MPKNQIPLKYLHTSRTDPYKLRDSRDSAASNSDKFYTKKNSPPASHKPVSPVPLGSSVRQTPVVNIFDLRQTISGSSGGSTCEDPNHLRPVATTPSPCPTSPFLFDRSPYPDDLRYTLGEQPCDLVVPGGIRDLRETMGYSSSGSGHEHPHHLHPVARTPSPCPTPSSHFDRSPAPHDLRQTIGGDSGGSSCEDSRTYRRNTLSPGAIESRPPTPLKTRNRHPDKKDSFFVNNYEKWICEHRDLTPVSKAMYLKLFSEYYHDNSKGPEWCHIIPQSHLNQIENFSKLETYTLFKCFGVETFEEFMGLDFLGFWAPPHIIDRSYYRRIDDPRNNLDGNLNCHTPAGVSTPAPGRTPSVRSKKGADLLYSPSTSFGQLITILNEMQRNYRKRIADKRYPNFVNWIVDTDGLAQKESPYYLHKRRAE